MKLQRKDTRLQMSRQCRNSYAPCAWESPPYEVGCPPFVEECHSQGRGAPRVYVCSRRFGDLARPRPRALCGTRHRPPLSYLILVPNLTRSFRRDSRPPLSSPTTSRDLPDPRLSPLCDHDSSISYLAICAVICGQHAWTDMNSTAKRTATGSSPFCACPTHPSHDTFRYVFRRLDPPAFQRCFGSWIEALKPGHEPLSTSPSTARPWRDSLDRAHRPGRPASGQRLGHAEPLGPGQVATDAKSTKSRHPRFWNWLDLAGHRDYRRDGLPEGDRPEISGGRRGLRLAVKGQPTALLADIQATLDRTPRRQARPRTRPTTSRRGGGTWCAGKCGRIPCLTNQDQVGAGPVWALIGGERAHGRGQTSTEVRYYIGACGGRYRICPGDPRHWGIETPCTGVLDVNVPGRCPAAAAEHGAGEHRVAAAHGGLGCVQRHDLQRSLRQKSIKTLCDQEFLLQLLSRLKG